MNKLLITLLLGLSVMATATTASARRGDDDGPGHVRQCRGCDDPAGHVRQGRSADDSADHVRHGRGADDPVGNQ